MKKILFLTVLGIAVMQMASAQFIDVFGRGVLNEPNPILIIDDISTVDSVMVEAIGHFVNIKGQPRNIPKNVTFLSGKSISAKFMKVDEIHSTVVKNTDPMTLSNLELSVGYYTATFKKGEFTAGTTPGTGTIALNKEGQGKSIISFYAYIFRKDGTVNQFSLLSKKRAYLYRSGEGDPVNYEFNLNAVQVDRNIKITIPFSDNYEPNIDVNKGDKRVAVVSLMLGNQEIHKETFNINELNTNFLDKTIEFDNVPGEVTKIKIAIYSPIDNSATGGDSFIAGMPVLTVEEVGECADCKGGITTLKLKYTGTTVAQKISVYKDKVDKKNLLAEFTKIKNNESIEFYGKEKNKTMGAKIIIVVSGSTKYTEIHTSCSKPIYAGMQFGVFNIVSGYSKDGGPLCFYEEPPCANCKGGVTALELMYNGAKAANISIYKGKVDKKSLLAEFNDVSTNQSLKFFGTMGTNIIITIDGKKHTEIHTSCSKPIYVGMTFGDFEIVSGASKDGGPLCEKPGDNGNCGTCKGGVTKLLLKYNGSGAGLSVKSKNVPISATYYADDKTILIYNNGDKLGTEIYITVDGTTTALHTSCSRPVYVGMQFGEFEIKSGTSKDGGPLCEKPVVCGDCKGGLTALTLKYLGTSTVSALTVKTDKGTVIVKKAANNTFSIYNGGTKLGTNIYISGTGIPTTTLHTSCSKPIYAGMIFGINDDFEIVSGTSKDGGSLCVQPGNGNCECEGGVTALTLEYLGPLTVNNLTVKTSKGTTTVIRATDGYFYIYDAGAKLGTNIYISATGIPTTTLHASCSQPIYAGMKFGGVNNNIFKIVDGTSLKGGKLCDVPYIKKKSAMIENIETIAEIHEFGVYPNPVLNTATVSFMPAYDGLATVELYNSLGQKAGSLLHQSVNKDVPVSFTFSGRKFNEGLYILILQNGDYRETAKIQISR